MRDPYEILNVAKTADQKEIKKAYHTMAKSLHPDLNPDKKGVEEKFKEVSSAYALLSDPEQRRRFDAGEIDASGQESAPRGFYRDYADQAAGQGYARQEGFSSEEDLEEFLSGMFGNRGARSAGGQQFKMRGSDVSYSLQIDFLDAAQGASKTITMPDGKSLSVKIPEGVTDRQTLRLGGKGNPGIGGGPPGDAYIEVHIRPHAYFSRKDNNIHVDVPVTLKEAVLGGQIEVPTVNGKVKMNVPKGSNTGTSLRLKEKGILDRRSGQRGHQYVNLKVVLPEKPDAELEKFAADWTPSSDDNPRDHMGGSS